MMHNVYYEIEPFIALAVAYPDTPLAIACATHREADDKIKEVLAELNRLGIHGSTAHMMNTVRLQNGSQIRAYCSQRPDAIRGTANAAVLFDNEDGWFDRINFKSNVLVSIRKKLGDNLPKGETA